MADWTATVDCKAGRIAASCKNWHVIQETRAWQARLIVLPEVTSDTDTDTHIHTCMHA